ncbi:hypothetical protein GE09DRAFT_1071129 [Coniochaeta sp. 2T2.1]|nr:hypothetical protein GE09DRAFT_1071129 [Coniochaeta sp. 2T2.1]
MHAPDASLLGLDTPATLPSLTAPDACAVAAQLSGAPDHAHLQPSPAAAPAPAFSADSGSTTRASTISATLSPGDSSAPHGHRCSECGRSYSRPADLRRHMPEHNPYARRFSCEYKHCDRKGSNGFLRRDKLKEHQDHKRHHV